MQMDEGIDFLRPDLIDVSGSIYRKLCQSDLELKKSLVQSHAPYREKDLYEDEPDCSCKFALKVKS